MWSCDSIGDGHQVAQSPRLRHLSRLEMRHCEPSDIYRRIRIK